MHECSLIQSSFDSAISQWCCI